MKDIALKIVIIAIVIIIAIEVHKSMAAAAPISESGSNNTPAQVTGTPVTTADGSINNGLNIKRSSDRFKGEMSQSDEDSYSKTFKSFTDISFSYRAGMVILRNYYQLHNLTTLMDLISRWAPMGDGKNNPVTYANYVAQQAGIDTNTDVYGWLFDDGEGIVLQKVISAMATMEGEVAYVNPQDVQQGYYNLIA